MFSNIITGYNVESFFFYIYYKRIFLIYIIYIKQHYIYVLHIIYILGKFQT